MEGRKVTRELNARKAKTTKRKANRKERMIVKPVKKVVSIFGVVIQRHHITVCILIAAAIYIAYGIAYGEIIHGTADAVLGIGLDRAMASIEEKVF